MAHNRSPVITTAQQLKAVQRDFSFGKIKKVALNNFEWEGILRSSPIGDEYRIKVIYKKGRAPEVYVLQPESLPLAVGKTRLEHVYDHEKQKLCLYDPESKEWNERKVLSTTIFPWIIEWLYHYEVWLITGKWSGGGRHPSSSKTLLLGP